MKKKSNVRTPSLLLLFLLSIVLTGCIPPVDLVLPTLTTTNASSVTSSSASSGGNISDDGGAAVTERGVCWNTTTSPTIANNKTSDGTGTGVFPSTLSNLSPGVTYYLKAYATNSKGTGYGNEVTFTTAANLSSITTTVVSAITTSSATSGGNITSDGGGAITARGVCWSTTTGPNITNSKTSDGAGTGNFVSSMTGLTPVTTYYVRAYATNSAGTSYGDEISFTVMTNLPTVATTATSAITATTATSGGNVTSDGGLLVIDRGVCWNTSAGPTISNTKTSVGSGTGIYIGSLTSLASNTTYYVRAFATNSAGTSYGNEISFRTLANIPTIVTSEVSSVTTTSASVGGTITSDGGASVSSRGVCWSTSSSPTTANSKTTDGSGTGSFTSSMNGLVAETIYYVRAYAINSAGTAYGNEVSFITESISFPKLTTTPVYSVTSSAAYSGGNISADGGAPVTERGICWGRSSSPTTANNKTSDGSGTGSFTSSIAGFMAGVNYYVRAYATNCAGTAYGNEVSFSLVSNGTVSDVDGNVYTTVKIGTQIWMASNLKVTRFNDNTGIPLVSDGTIWVNLATPGYCWYDNNPTNKAAYGPLYNWFTVGAGKLCPTGWHVASDDDWTILTDFLGGIDNVGGKLKETGFSHWNSPNANATNETGFSAIPGGARNQYSEFFNIGTVGYWWSSTLLYVEFRSDTFAWTRLMDHTTGGVARILGTKTDGRSVRCLKN